MDVDDNWLCFFVDLVKHHSCTLLLNLFFTLMKKAFIVWLVVWGLQHLMNMTGLEIVWWKKIPAQGSFKNKGINFLYLW